MPSNRKRSSNPNPPTSSIAYSAQDRSTVVSSVFPYSTARPPTDYSTQSWVPPPAKPNVKRKNSDPAPDVNPFGGIVEEDERDGGETPLCTRDDWGEGDHEIYAHQTGSAYSRSSFAGTNTAGPAPSAGFTTALGGIMEDEDDESPPRHQEKQGGTRRVSRFSASARSARSTLPSVLDLEHLTSRKPGKGAKSKRGSGKNTSDDPGARQRNGYSAQPTPELDGARQGFRNVLDQTSLDADVEKLEPMTPGAHNRLGRMSVARPKHSTNAGVDPQTLGLDKQNEGMRSNPPMTFWGKFKRHHYAYRPAVNTVLSIISAMILTVSLQQSGQGLGQIISVKSGVFGVSAAGGDVGLGVSEWCQTGGNANCRPYGDGDFANKDATFTIPGSTLFTSLHNLFIALMTLAYIHMVYNLITSFFHYYLFFALSIPHYHLIDIKNNHAQNPFSDLTADEEVIQAEVDIRVKCERIPFESYIWVWWVWWGHCRGPLGGFYAVIVGILAFVSFFVAIGFQRSVISATGSSSGVSLGVGAIIPFVVFLLNLDAFYPGVKWFYSSSSSWSTFTNPPEPSPAALMLSTEKRVPLTHRRNTRGSFYAPRITLDQQTNTNSNQAENPFSPNHPQPLPSSNGNTDPETRRWLVAYPHDPELVPLIASLRSGEENDDFILSDVGLLYLRPEGDEAALLVPPAGEIRRELVEDGHIGEDGEHVDEEGMMKGLGAVFWWMTMEDEVRDMVQHCTVCKARGRGNRELKPGMTPLPFTGVTGYTAAMGEMQTGWTAGESAMAADMAFAMRKAEEEAGRGRIG